MNTSTRAEFEAWCDRQYGNQAYLHKSATCGEWDAWQAACRTSELAPRPTARRAWVDVCAGCQTCNFIGDHIIGIEFDSPQCSDSSPQCPQDSPQLSGDSPQSTGYCADGVASVVDELNPRQRARKLALAQKAQAIKPNMPISWLSLLEWASGLESDIYDRGRQ